MAIWWHNKHPKPALQTFHPSRPLSVLLLEWFHGEIRRNGWRKSSSSGGRITTSSRGGPSSIVSFIVRHCLRWMSAVASSTNTVVDRSLQQQQHGTSTQQQLPVALQLVHTLFFVCTQLYVYLFQQITPSSRPRPSSSGSAPFRNASEVRNGTFSFVDEILLRNRPSW